MAQAQLNTVHTYYHGVGYLYSSIKLYVYYVSNKMAITFESVY